VATLSAVEAWGRAAAAVGKKIDASKLRVAGKSAGWT